MAHMFLIRWAIAAIMLMTIVPWSWVILTSTWERVSGRFLDPLPMSAGIALAIAMIIWRKPNWLIHTVIHEACHAIACLLLGVRIHNFQASDGKGGMVVHDRVDPLRGTIISLAPYTLPLLLLPLLLARTWVIDKDWRWWLSGLVAFAYVHHVHGLYHNVRLNFWGRQADLTKAGRPLSIASIASILLLVSACTLRVLAR